MQQEFKIGILQKLKSFISFYFSLQDIDEHYVLKIFGAKICIRHKTEVLLPELETIGVTENKREKKIIVSLTTYPARINSVYKTITTLLNQTVKPDEVVLWLAEEQFPDKNLPENLLKLENFGLSIRWCEDIKSFKKLVPSLGEFPEDIIITADDDIFYPQNFVESLYERYLRHPQYIHANRAFLIKKKKGKYAICSRNYEYNETYFPGFRNEFMTGYGTLFPPHSLDEEVSDSKKFMLLMPTNDDVWFWGMAVKKGSKICVNPNGYKLKLIIDRTIQGDALWRLNMNNTTVGTNGSDGVNILAEMYEEIKSAL